MLVVFNSLQSILRDEGFNSYKCEAGLYDKEGNIKDSLVIEIPKSRFEKGNLVCYAIK